jgi:hypothetical protein
MNGLTASDIEAARKPRRVVGEDTVLSRDGGPERERSSHPGAQFDLKRVIDRSICASENRVSQRGELTDECRRANTIRPDQVRQVDCTMVLADAFAREGTASEDLQVAQIRTVQEMWLRGLRQLLTRYR